MRTALVNYCNRYQIKLSADDIIITCGGSEAVLFAFINCLNPGDEIIVPEPAYANYMAFAVLAGAVIRTIATTIEEGFCLPKVERFEELINERTKAILIYNPNNPTGYLYTQKEMNQILDLVKKHNLYLFSDEVYSKEVDLYLASLRVADDFLAIVNLGLFSVLTIGYMTHLAHRFTTLGDIFLLADTLHIVVDGTLTDVRKIVKVFLQMVVELFLAHRLVPANRVAVDTQQLRNLRLAVALSG